MSGSSSSYSFRPNERTSLRGDERKPGSDQVPADMSDFEYASTASSTVNASKPGNYQVPADDVYETKIESTILTGKSNVINEEKPRCKLTDQSQSIRENVKVASTREPQQTSAQQEREKAVSERLFLDALGQITQQFESLQTQIKDLRNGPAASQHNRPPNYPTTPEAKNSVREEKRPDQVSLQPRSAAPYSMTFDSGNRFTTTANRVPGQNVPVIKRLRIFFHFKDYGRAVIELDIANCPMTCAFFLASMKTRALMWDGTRGTTGGHLLWTTRPFDFATSGDKDISNEKENYWGLKYWDLRVPRTVFWLTSNPMGERFFGRVVVGADFLGRDPQEEFQLLGYGLVE